MRKHSLFFTALLLGLLAVYGYAQAPPTTITFGSSAATTNNSGSPTIENPHNPGWSPALPGSVWISYTSGGVPNASGDCTSSLTPGCVTFTQTFLTPAAGYSGSVTVMADDSTNVALNGVQLMAEAPGEGSHYNWCSDFPIGCLTSTQATIPLHNLPAGTNTLSFTVAQRTGSSFGLDLAGQVTAATVAISKTSESFLLRTVGGTSPTQRVTLTNIGSDPLNISGIKLTGTNHGDFAKGSNCGTSLAVGKSCLIGVTFTPTAQGDRIALVSIADSSPDSPQLVTLEGRGTFFGRIPWSMDFGDQPVGTTSATQTTSPTPDLRRWPSTRSRLVERTPATSPRPTPAGRASTQGQSAR